MSILDRPLAVISPETRRQAFHFCQQLAKKTGKNFYFSFLTLPADQRRDMCALYAYMRLCDDIGDDDTVPLERRGEQLSEWRRNVEAVLSGSETTHPVLIALADVVARRHVPTAPLLDVISGVERDLEPVRYETFAELENYCYHVAGTVGLCCIHIWGFHDQAAIAQAIDCGLAFQLTNILRDLAEDSALGRRYLPLEDLERFGYSEQELARGDRNAAYYELMKFEVARARHYYARSEALFDSLAPTGHPVLAAMRRIYGGLLDKIERQNYDVFSQRIRLSHWHKLAIVARVLICRR